MNYREPKIYIKINGNNIALFDYCKGNRKQYCRIYSRLKLGWSVEDAINIKKHGVYGHGMI